MGPRTSCGAEVPTRGSLKICRGRAGLTYLRLLAILFVASAANTAVAQQSVAPSSPPSHADSGGKPSPGAAEGAGNTAASTRPAENAKSKGDTDKGGSKELPATKAPANTANGKSADKPALKDRGASKGSTVGPAPKGTHERAGTNEKGSGNNAIDTRITVQPRPVLKLPPRPSVATIPPNSRTLFHQSSPREIASPVRNATGILVSTPHAAKTPIVGPSPTAAYGSAIGSVPHAGRHCCTQHRSSGCGFDRSCLPSVEQQRNHRNGCDSSGRGCRRDRWPSQERRGHQRDRVSTQATLDPVRPLRGASMSRCCGPATRRHPRFFLACGVGATCS